MKRLIVSVLAAAVCSTAPGFEDGRARFNVEVGDEVVPYRVFAIFALPGEALQISTAESEAQLFHAGSRGPILSAGAGTWTWTAPDRPGVYELDVQGRDDSIRLNVIVMHPAASVINGRLNGYRIGSYPRSPLRGNAAYLPPEGFVELNAATAELQLSPHFRLSQFPSKQSAAEYPKYLALRERLLLKLELLLEEINARGIEAETLTIMSGYRTPFYNAAIGNVPHSRHIYGGAADVFIDVAPADGVMDDLNGDGKRNYRDAQLLYRWADALYRSRRGDQLAGGLGVYRSTAAHGPFLHIDARGQRARWGLIP